jgi:hypothetical protein
MFFSSDKKDAVVAYKKEQHITALYGVSASDSNAEIYQGIVFEDKLYKVPEEYLEEADNLFRKYSLNNDQMEIRMFLSKYPCSGIPFNARLF